MRVLRLGDFEEAVPLAASERAAYRRRFVMLFEDETSRRGGGHGSVSRVTNALGEEFALKVLSLPEGADVETLVSAFHEEYACQRALSGLRGFPRLYGRGTVDGVPAIVMEWVRGETLAHARGRLAVDAEGRLSPLTAARVGHDLFGLLCRMDLVGPGYVHRDVSPANVMVRTAALSVEQQADEGSFDLCLVDFGSGVAAGVAGQEPPSAALPDVRRATAGYAPPEMLDEGLSQTAKLRRSPAVDVYEASSVLYQLVSGRVPYDLDGVASPARLKAAERPAYPETAHVEGSNLADVLPLEPEVAVMVARLVTSHSPEPTPVLVRQALDLVDGQLVSLVLSELAARADERPTAEAMRAGLAAFCANYEANVGRALRGEALIPVTGGQAWADSMPPLALRRMLRSAGKAVSWAVWLGVVVTSAMLLSGAPAAFALGDVRWSGRLSGLVVGAVLAAPMVAGAAARGFHAASRVAFLRGTAALLVLSAVVWCLASRLALVPTERVQGLYAAIFATFAAAWCPLVLDFATLAAPAIIAEVRRRLPVGKERGRGPLGGPTTSDVGAGLGASGTGAPLPGNSGSATTPKQSEVTPHDGRE